MKYDAVAIGNRAYEARKNKNIKQNDMSAALGIAQSSYSRFELGQYDIPISKLMLVCEILDISVSWLIGEDIIPQLTDRECLELENYKKYLISKRE